MQQRRLGLNAEECEKLHSMSIVLLESLKSNTPDKMGEASGWNFEKAHSILHKVQIAHSISTTLHNLLYNRSEKSSCLAALKISALKGQNISTLSSEIERRWQGEHLDRKETHWVLLSIKVTKCYIWCHISYIALYALAGWGCIDKCRKKAISNGLWSSSCGQRVTGHQSVEGWEAFTSTPTSDFCSVRIPAMAQAK